MPHDFTYEDLLRIVELIKASDQFSEFRLKIGDIEVELRRRVDRVAAAPRTPPADAPAAVARNHASEPELPRTDSEASWPEGSIVIRAPMVGTFYRAPEPGARPFVEVGDMVDDHSTVCIIEVMKLMNSIAAGARGMVTHVLVDDATPVATGQPLIVVLAELPAP